jgi:hypothetical protein
MKRSLINLNRLFEHARRHQDQGAGLTRLRKYAQRRYGWLHAGLRGKVLPRAMSPDLNTATERLTPCNPSKAPPKRPRVVSVGITRDWGVIISLIAPYLGLDLLCLIFVS